MLHEFITDNRDELIARVRTRVAQRAMPRATQPELEHGIPLFLNQLATLLQSTMTLGEEDDARTRLTSTAGAYGQELLGRGLTVAQVVHDYGDVCQVVTELAVERRAPIAAEDFRAFNRCLDDAIAGAVTAYSRVRERSIAAEGTERLGVLAHELRNLLSTAMLSFDAIRRGVAGTSGSVGAVHARSLMQLRDLIDRSLTEVRLDAAIVHLERVVVAQFIEEAEIGATIQAQAHGISLSVAMVDVGLVVEIDAPLVAGALSNLLQNAFKFTPRGGVVSVITTATKLRVTIAVEDRCGGLPVGDPEDLFRAFEQRSTDRKGVGLGLSIARRAVEANGGELHVLDLPRIGCRFTIDLPNRSALPAGPKTGALLSAH